MARREHERRAGGRGLRRRRPHTPARPAHGRRRGPRAASSVLSQQILRKLQLSNTIFSNTHFLWTIMTSNLVRWCPQTSVGPILIAMNAYTDAGNALTPSAARAQRPELARLVHDAVRHQADTGSPQAIILSGN